MKDGGSIVTLRLKGNVLSSNWMGVNKAAIEAVVKALARNCGKDPYLRKMRFQRDPEYQNGHKPPYLDHLSETWEQISPWDTIEDKAEVAGGWSSVW